MSTIHRPATPAIPHIENLLTVQDFLAWQEANAAILCAAKEQRRRDIEAAETARFLRAQDAVFRDLMPMLERGLSFGEAGDEMRHGWDRWRAYTFDDLVTVLRAIGWRPTKGGAA